MPGRCDPQYLTSNHILQYIIENTKETRFSETRLKCNFNQGKYNFETESVTRNHSKDRKGLQASFSVYYVKILQISITSKGKKNYTYACPPPHTDRKPEESFQILFPAASLLRLGLQNAFEGRRPTLKLLAATLLLL